MWRDGLGVGVSRWPGPGAARNGYEWGVGSVGRDWGMGEEGDVGREEWERGSAEGEVDGGWSPATMYREMELRHGYMDG